MKCPEGVLRLDELLSMVSIHRRESLGGGPVMLNFKPSNSPLYVGVASPKHGRHTHICEFPLSMLMVGLVPFPYTWLSMDKYLECFMS